jgi:hypothetical protein
MSISPKIRLSIIPAKAVQDRKISNTVFRTLAIICMYTNKETKTCFPSLSTLAGIRGVSKSQISRDINCLVDLGYVRKKPRFRDDGSRSSNILEVIFDSLSRVNVNSPIEIIGNEPLHPTCDTPSPLECNTPLHTECNSYMHPEREVTDNITKKSNEEGERYSFPKNTGKDLSSSYLDSDNMIPKKASKTSELSDIEQDLLRELETGMTINFPRNSKVKNLAEFLVERSTREERQIYTRYAKEQGMHKTEMAKYASFPDDIIAEFAQAIKKHGDTEAFNNAAKAARKSAEW